MKVDITGNAGRAGKDISLHVKGLGPADALENDVRQVVEVVVTRLGGKDLVGAQA